MCMCRSTSMQRPRGRAARGSRTRREAGGGARRAPRTAPRSRRRRAPTTAVVRVVSTPARRRSSRSPSEIRRLELPGERDDVAGLELQADVAVAEHLDVGATRGGDRHHAGAERADQQAGGGRLPERGGDEHVGLREHRLLGRVVPAATTLHAPAQPAAQRRAPRRRGRRSSPPTPRRPAGPQGAQEQPQRGALLGVAEGQPHGRARRPRAGRSSTVAPGRSTW